MSANARVSGFQPSVNGLHFSNSFPHEPDIVVEVPPFGRIPIGDASNGLCGGMVFTVRDVFETPGMVPLPDANPPAPGTPLFEYLVARLIDSFDLAHGGFMRYYHAMIAPDGDTGWAPFFVRRGLAWETIAVEWATRIRPDLDAGRLCCLGLVTTSSTNPADLGHNHQVLAYGYDLDDADNLTLLVCDPNTSGAAADAVRIRLNLANPTQATPISHNVNVGNPIRGFFRVAYERRDPSALAARPLAIAGLGPAG